MEVMEIERALADLSREAKVPATADSADRATAADYQMMINHLEEMLAGVEAPHPDITKLLELQNEVQRILKMLQHRVIARINAAAEAVTSGRPLGEFTKPRTNLTKVVAIIDELSKRIVAAAHRRTVEMGRSAEAHEPTVVDSSQPTEDHAPMTDLSRQELKAELAASEAKVDARLANFDTSVKTGFAELRSEFADLRAGFSDLRTEMANGRADAAKQNHESVKWIIGSVFAMLSISVAIIGVMINLNRSERAPVAPIAQPAPIVITVPTTAPSHSPPTR